MVNWEKETEAEIQTEEETDMIPEETDAESEAYETVEMVSTVETKVPEETTAVKQGPQQKGQNHLLQRQRMLI